MREKGEIKYMNLKWSPVDLGSSSLNKDPKSGLGGARLESKLLGTLARRRRVGEREFESPNSVF